MASEKPAHPFAWEKRSSRHSDPAEGGDLAGRLAGDFVRQHRDDMAYSLAKIRHFLEQLGEEDVWWRPHEEHNAIGNIILHLCGNIRQWLINGITQQPDVRDRPAEFAGRDPIPKAELLDRLAATIREADAVLGKLSPEDLVAARRIQGFDVTVMQAINSSVPHLAGHVQEMCWITRLRLGDRYRFFWTPTTPEQGAAAS